VCSTVPIAGGFGLSATLAGPSPSPVAPWQLAQLLSKSAFPSARSSGLAGNSSLASLPSTAANRLSSESTEAGGRLAATASAIVSSSARAGSALDPESRSAARFASTRKSLVSWYSWALMSRPRASTAFAYSSTATLTMLAARRAGCSWAAAGSATQHAARARNWGSPLGLLIAEEMYRDLQCCASQCDGTARQRRNRPNQPRSSCSAGGSASTLA